MKKIFVMLVVAVLLSGCSVAMTLNCPVGKPIAVIPKFDAYGQTKVVCGAPADGKVANISFSNMSITNELILPPSVIRLDFNQ